ncbi:MAG: hypothetical protein ABJN34_14220 [Litoreibacter sp.]|uniref:hypothetical protein n=1 Tax=Litoreibacter sp. TaxID=1969459 RepID=UPI003299935B
MRLWVVLTPAAIALAGCGKNPLPDLRSDGTNAALTEVTVTSDRVILRGPDGFCVDPASSNHKPSKAFMVFGNCAAIAADEELPQPFINAIVTATVLPAGREQPRIAHSSVALASFFESDAGKAALSASGNANSVEILDSFSRNNAFFIHARDKSAPVVPGTENTYWRGYFDVKKSVVTVSVFGLKSAPVSSSEGLQTLYDFGNALLEGQEQDETGATPAKAGDVAHTGLLRRIFG